MTWKTVPIPERMAALQRDPRGYPIPFLAARDPAGRAHFTINDPVRHRACLQKDLCAICGRPHTRGRWFVGGPGSAFHPDGWYLDPPLHKECMTYAMQVCPYLAMPSYSGRIDDRTVDYEAHPGLATVLASQAQDGRPALFVAIMGIANETDTDGVTTVVRPKKRNIRAVEYWKDGQRLEASVGHLEAMMSAEAINGQ